jgi:hypothetical protein
MAMNDIYEAVTWWQENIERAACVLHYIVTGGDNADTAHPIDVANALADYCNTHWESLCDSVQCDTVGQLCTQARRVGPFPGASVIGFSTGLGDLTTETVGAQEALLIQKYTDQVGPTGRGRTYVPFISEQILVDGRIHVDVFSSIDEDIIALLVTDFSLAVPGVQMTGGVLSRSTGFCNPITRWAIRPATASQRRRVDPLSTWSSTS